MTDIPDDMMEKAQEWRSKLLEVVVEQDDDVMMAYLEGEVTLALPNPNPNPKPKPNPNPNPYPNPNPNPYSNPIPNQEPSVEELKACIRKGTLGNDFVPVLTGTAFKNKGVQVTLTPEP